MPIVSFVVPGLLWVWLCWNLHYEWMLNPQYNYGWAVPVLALFLFHARWTSRPTRSPAPSPILAGGANMLLLALLLPVRLVEEANPDWRLLSWILALAVAGYSLVALARHGGASWLRHFAFPICFALVAVPWLVQFENFVVQNLTHTVAAAAVEIAGWAGLGAYQLGNVIQLRNGFVGVDEACSGVRTLQTAIMVSLFLGELFWLTAARRVALVAVSCAWVLICNIARASILVIIAGTRGFEALHQAHDSVGGAVMVVGVLGIAAAAWLLRDRAAPSSAVVYPAEVASHSASPIVPTLTALAWLVVVFAATEWWYRAHERQLVARPAWSVEWSRHDADFRMLAIPDSTQVILRFNSAESASWRGADSSEWWGFFARWEPGRTALQLVRSHSPDICLPAVGRQFERELPTTHFDSAAGALGFHAYQFIQEGKPLFVFVCIQEDKFARGAELQAGDWSSAGRLRAVRQGQRNLGQRLLELAVTDLGDFEQARTAAAEVVRAIVR
ncbi:MAG: exosortase/archaeosortase family protein [Chthoniobacterales bacterium]